MVAIKIAVISRFLVEAYNARQYLYVTKLKTAVISWYYFAPSPKDIALQRSTSRRNLIITSTPHISDTERNNHNV